MTVPLGNPDYSSGPIRVRRVFFSDWRCFASRIFSLRPPRPAPFLTSDLLDPHPLGADESRLESFDPVEEQPPGNKPVQRLGAFLLAFYGEACRQMDEIDAGRGLVDLLTAGSGGTDESFPKFLFPDAETLHPLPECCFFFLGNGHLYQVSRKSVSRNGASQRE